MALVALLAAGTPAAAQGTPTGTLLDALSITVQRDSAPDARGSMRYRIVRSGTDTELVASGILVQRGLRVTAELRTDTQYVFRRYLAESRDSSGRLVDRLLVTSAGGRITLERVTPLRRMVREFGARRDLVLLDSASAVPFVSIAARPAREDTVTVLDARRGVVTGAARLAVAASADLSVAEVVVTGTAISVPALPMTVTWWRDGKGRLLRVSWGTRLRIQRDDPPT
jgi:hypothetical protein